MRRTLLILGAILLASFGISYAKPNSTQEKTGSTEPKITPEDAAKKNPVGQRRKDWRKRANFLATIALCVTARWVMGRAISLRT